MSPSLTSTHPISQDVRTMSPSLTSPHLISQDVRTMSVVRTLRVPDVTFCCSFAQRDGREWLVLPGSKGQLTMFDIQNPAMQRYAGHASLPPGSPPPLGSPPFRSLGYAAPGCFPGWPLTLPTEIQFQLPFQICPQYAPISSPLPPEQSASRSPSALVVELMAHCWSSRRHQVAA